LSTDPREARRLRLGVLVAALALLGVLAAAGYRALTPPWRAVQAGFRERLGPAAGRVATGVREVRTCTGALERCTTCHLGATRADLRGTSVPLPYRAHALDLAPHPPATVGCTACHGGNGRALDPAAAHAWPGGGGAPDPLRRSPYLQASCLRCHVPGDAPGMERLARGARLYQGLGCAVCHPLTPGGRGGWDYGPDLTATGRRSPRQLETSLLDPAANFPGSTMPSFRHALGEEPEGRTDLVIYLLGLTLPPAPPSCSLRGRSDALVHRPCATCHAGVAGRAGGRLAHRCGYLRERREHLRCAGCHPEAVPQPGAGQGWCPVIRAQRDGCEACHQRDDEGRAR